MILKGPANMKSFMRRFLALLLCLLMLGGIALPVCADDASVSAGEGATFRIDFYVYNPVTCQKTLLATKWVAEGTMPQTPAVPDMAAPEELEQMIDHYTFDYWDPVIEKAYSSTDYVAMMKSVLREYTVKYVDGDGQVLQSDTLPYEENIPAYTGGTPTKASDPEFEYTFSNAWSPDPNQADLFVDQDYTFVAQFSKSRRTYPVTWKNDDGSVIGITTVEYGEVPDRADPVKADTDEFTYTFAGWDPEPTAVVGAAAYQATFTSEKRTYPITWKNDDGSVIETTNVAYGEMPVHADATKADDNQYSYTFTGWTPEIAAVTGDATYTATYEKQDLSVTYELIVVNGTGSGLYKPGTVVRITANAPEDGMKFQEWIGDTAGIRRGGGSPYLAETILKMPDGTTTVTAIYGGQSAIGQTAITSPVSMGADEVKRTEAEQAERDAAINTFGDWEAEDENGDPVVVLIGGFNEPSNGITDEMKADFEALADVLVDAGTDEASIPADLAADAADGAILAATDPFRAVASSYPATVTISLNDPDAFVGMMTFLNGKWVKLDTIINDDGTVTFTLDKPAVLSIVSQIPDAA